MKMVIKLLGYILKFFGLHLISSKERAILMEIKTDVDSKFYRNRLSHRFMDYDEQNKLLKELSDKVGHVIDKSHTRADLSRLYELLSLLNRCMGRVVKGITSFTRAVMSLRRSRIRYNNQIFSGFASRSSFDNIRHCQAGVSFAVPFRRDGIYVMR